MKVGIVSQYANDNFGNKLQNYAVQQVLRLKADSVITIRNEPRPDSVKRKILCALRLDEVISVFFLFGKHRKAKHLEFQKKYMACSSRSYCLEESARCLAAEDTCDLYCAGSDQIWKTTSGRAGPFHFLPFADYDRTFSYAASFGIDKIPEEHVEAVRKGLNHIKFISVREDAGKRIVEELTGRTDAQVHVDPTMLLTTEQWDAVTEKPKAKLPEKYLLIYFLGDVSDERRKTIEAKARELGCKTIWLMDKKSPFYGIGPGYFVYLIKHAQMVCTDSFHGSVFSFLYGRPLAIYDRKGGGENMSSRLETLVAKFSLQEQLVQKDDLDAIPLKIDYSRGYVALEKEREKSKKYLDMVFEEAERAGLCK